MGVTLCVGVLVLSECHALCGCVDAECVSRSVCVWGGMLMLSVCHALCVWGGVLMLSVCHALCVGVLMLNVCHALCGCVDTECVSRSVSVWAC